MLKISPDFVSVGKIFDVSPRIAWNLITDTAKWPAWGPSLKAVRCTERYICAETEGQIQTAVGIWLPFVVTAYEHLSYWSWKVANISATGHRIQPVDRSGCCLWFEVPLLAAPYILICQLALKRIDKMLAK